MTSAFIFDMDGLMVDTETMARRSWDVVVSPYGHQISDDLYDQMLGRRTPECVRLVLVELPLPISFDELHTRKTDAYLALLDDGIPVMPGLYTLLDALDTADIPWAVATSSPRAIAERILDYLGLTARCGALAAGDEVAQGKPAPDIFLLAAERLRVDPANCVALEDSPAGCQAAATAGMRVLVVPTEMTERETFACATARYLSLAHVAAEIDRWQTLS